MTRQMTRSEFNAYVSRKDPLPCRCELEKCPFHDEQEKRMYQLDCLDCVHWVWEVQDE